MSTSFFTEINYSAANEDGRSERFALGEKLTGGRVLCITGSGARPLELLIGDPREVVAVDFNPTQTWLLELKIAAIRAMDHREFLSFVGVLPDGHRRAEYRRLRTQLSPECRAYWERNMERITHGILYCGRWENYLESMAGVFQFAQGEGIRALLESRSMEEQQECWGRMTETQGWKLLMHLVSLRALWKYVAREPGIDLVPRRLNIARVLNGRLNMAARTHLFRECAFAHLMMRGRYSEEALPCHLEAGNYATIRQRIDAITLRTDSIVGHLRDNGGAYDGYSISDFGSYASAPIYQATWRALQENANPGCRVCERLFLVPRSPQKLPGIRFHREFRSEREAALMDRSFVYRFVIGAFS